MSRAIEDSKQKAIVVGGAVIPLEREIEIPPEKAKDFTPVENNIENGEYIEISVSEKCDIREVLSPKQIKEFMQNREEKRPWAAEKQNEVEK